MKIVSIGLILLSIFWGARKYVEILESRLDWLKGWEAILRVWREWISCYSYSVDEIIQKTSDDEALCGFSICKKICKKRIEDILEDTRNEPFVLEADKQIVINVLLRIGNSMLDIEVEVLTSAIAKLSESVEKCNCILKERRVLVYKLTPLLCGAIFVLLW